MIVRFPPQTGFSAALKSRVAAYVAAQDSRSIRHRMLLKTAVVFAWALASYLAYLLLATEWWHVGLAAASMGLAGAGIGMSVMHDANHGSYPVGPRLRRALGWSLDVLGGSSYIWRFQHNVNHHTFTNVNDADHDITIGGIARLSPAQPRRFYHRFQHFYLWPLYAFLQLNWAFWADWRDYGTASIGENPFPRPRGKEAALFWLGKLAWVAVWFVIPLLFQPGGSVAIFGLTTYLVAGFVLSVVFQLAHVVDCVEFPEVRRDDPRCEREFLAHQVATTADFAQDNKLLGWYLGGLNFQVEHHLFPKLCHLYYPGIAVIVRETCKQYGMPYHCFATMGDAIRSHNQWLRTMGMAAAQ